MSADDAHAQRLIDRRLARADVEMAEIALRNATAPYERAHRAYKAAELELSKAKLREADVLDRQAIEAKATPPPPSREYEEADEQLWGEAPPRDGVDQYAREVDPFYRGGGS